MARRLLREAVEKLGPVAGTAGTTTGLGLGMARRLLREAVKMLGGFI
jgi:hypothetical protein